MRGGCCGLGRRSGDCGLAGECLDFSKQILLHHNDICNGNLAILVYVCCLLCGLVVGVIEKLFGTLFNDAISQITLFALFVLILLFKPSGILGKEKE